MDKLIKPFIIGISGLAGSGKDTLTKYIIESFGEFQFQHMSLAEELKRSLKDFCEKQFGISPFTIDREKKSLIRPILVETARVKRIVSKGTYYTSLLEPRVNQCFFDNKIPIISDIRYAEYEEDEVFWIKNNRGIIIHVERDGVTPPNQDEAKNDPIIKKMADIKIKWHSMNLENISEFMSMKGYNTLIKSKLYERSYGK